jgi:hypothetical protein
VAESELLKVMQQSDAFIRDFQQASEKDKLLKAKAALCDSAATS